MHFGAFWCPEHLNAYNYYNVPPQKHFWTTCNLQSASKVPCGATICVHPLIRLLHVLLVSMLVLFFALHWMIVKNGHYFHILLVISALLWRPAQRAESFMESSLGSNFKSWSRPLTFLNIFTAQLKIVSPNIIRQQTIWHENWPAVQEREQKRKMFRKTDLK